MANKTPRVGSDERMARMRAAKALKRAFREADWPVDDGDPRVPAWLGGMVGRGLTPAEVPALVASWKAAKAAEKSSPSPAGAPGQGAGDVRRTLDPLLAEASRDMVARRQEAALEQAQALERERSTRRSTTNVEPSPRSETTPASNGNFAVDRDPLLGREGPVPSGEGEGGHPARAGGVARAGDVPLREAARDGHVPHGEPTDAEVEAEIYRRAAARFDAARYSGYPDQFKVFLHQERQRYGERVAAERAGAAAQAERARLLAELRAQPPNLARACRRCGLAVAGYGLLGLEDAVDRHLADCPGPLEPVRILR